MMMCIRMCTTIVTDLAGSWRNTQSPYNLRCKSDTGSERKGGYNNWNNILRMRYKNLQFKEV